MLIYQISFIRELLAATVHDSVEKRWRLNPSFLRIVAVRKM